MIFLDVQQNTQEWYSARCGVCSASNFAKIVTTKGDRSKSREKYLYELAGERITGEPKEHYTNENMERGHEREAESRSTYELINGCSVSLVGFILLDENRDIGCSPDGLVGDDGGFENKDALPHVQIDRLENGWSDADHFQQVQGCLYVTDREWWDLVSYSRGIQPIIKRFERDEEFIKKLAIELKLFVNDLKAIVKKYGVNND